MFKSGKYPNLSTVLKAALSIFTGRHMETSFSMTNDVINKRSSQMDIATYGAIMNVKYGLIAKSQSSFQKYHRRNILRDPINHILIYNMRTANSRYTKRLQQKRAETRTKTLQYRPTSLMTKKIAPKMKGRKSKEKSKFEKVCKAASVVKNIEKKIGVEAPVMVTKPVQRAGGIDFIKDVKRKCDDDSFVPAPKRVKQVSLMNFLKK